MGRHGCYVWDVLPDLAGTGFTTAIEQYHAENGPVLVPRHKHNTPETLSPLLLERIESLVPQHIEMIHAFLPRRVIREARSVFYRRLYHGVKRKVVFVAEALSQVRDYDPFLISVDDVHEADMLMTSMFSRMAFYAERI